MDQPRPTDAAGGGGGGGYDPLAALMAPPTRAIRPTTTNDDPLAQMMAPRFTSLPNPGGNTLTTGSTPPVSSAGGPPPTGGVPGGAAAGPPKFNVWKPKPTENVAFASNPDVNSLMNQYQSQIPTTNPGIAAEVPAPDTSNNDNNVGMTEVPLDGQGPPPTNNFSQYQYNAQPYANAYNDDAYANLG